MHTVVFSTPRTGSVLLTIIIKRYLARKFGHILYRGEFFNENNYNLFHVERDGQQFNLPDPVAGATRLRPYLEGGGIVNRPTTIKVDVAVETRRRIDILRRLGTPHIFKEHAAPLAEEAFQALRQLASFVCIERRNKLDQMLSFAVAHHTKVWWAPLSLDSYPAPSHVVLSRYLFNQLADRIDVYRQRVAQLDDPVTVCYEDMLALDTPFAVLDTLGYRDWRDYIDPAVEVLPAKISSVVDPSAYANLAEIKDWCSEVFPDG